MLLYNYYHFVMSKRRKWNDDKVQFGFTYTGKNALRKHQVILCHAVFSNSNLKPSWLKEHFYYKLGGSDVAGNNTTSLQIKRIRFDSLVTLSKSILVFVGKPILLALNKVAYKVARPQKPQSIAEDLIKPSALEIPTTIVCWDRKQKKA